MSTNFRPAPMLGETEAPDLIRGSPETIPAEVDQEEEGGGRQGDGGNRASSSSDDATLQRNLKRGSVDLEQGIEGLEVDEGVHSTGTSGDGAGGGGMRKRRA